MSSLMELRRRCAGHQAKESALRAGRGLQHLVYENPLAVGAAAVMIGAAVGLALPRTRIEHEYMGEASEKLVDKAQQVARDAMDKVKTVAAGRTTWTARWRGSPSRPGSPSQPGEINRVRSNPARDNPGQLNPANQRPPRKDVIGAPEAYSQRSNPNKIRVLTLR